MTSPHAIIARTLRNLTGACDSNGAAELVIAELEAEGWRVIKPTWPAFTTTVATEPRWPR